MQSCSRRRPHMHIVRTCHPHVHVIRTCRPHLHIVHTHTCHPHIICSTPHGQHRPKLSFYSDRIWLLNGICHKNVELFHFRIILMICKIICIDGFLCMLHLDIVHMLSVYVHVIHTLSGHMCIMRTLFAVVLDIFLPNRQCLCHSYVISSTLYISYHIQLSFYTLSRQTYIVGAI